LQAEEDKESFLSTLAKFKSRFGFKLYGFVIMDNHAHLVIEALNHITISKIMHAVTLSYSVKFRKKYSYTGYVWQGRFNSNVIENDSYILHCLEYIHNNPIRAKMVKRVQNYPWSSYRYYNGLGSLKDCVKIDRFQG
jgi:REP element-mobilizing transposase RayT